MLYNCANGRTLNLSTEYYFSLTDNELVELCDCYKAVDILDPFYDSILLDSIPKDISLSEDTEFDSFEED